MTIFIFFIWSDQSNIFITLYRPSRYPRRRTYFLQCNKFHNSALSFRLKLHAPCSQSLFERNHIFLNSIFAFYTGINRTKDSHFYDSSVLFTLKRITLEFLFWICKCTTLLRIWFIAWPEMILWILWSHAWQQKKNLIASLRSDSFRSFYYFFFN